MPTREQRHLYSGYNVQTQVESYAWVDLDRVKLLKMDESSKDRDRKKEAAQDADLERELQGIGFSAKAPATAPSEPASAEWL